MAIKLNMDKTDGSIFNYHRVTHVNCDVKTGKCLFAVHSFKDAEWAAAGKAHGLERWYRLAPGVIKSDTLDAVITAAYEQLKVLPEWVGGEDC